MLVVDTEGTGLRAYHGALATWLAWFSIDTQTGTTDGGFVKANQKSADHLRDLMEDHDAVVLHNAKHDAALLRRQFGVEMPWTKTHDTLIMARLAYDQEASLSLLGLSIKYLGYNGAADLRILELAKKMKVKGNYDLLPMDKLQVYTMRQLHNVACLFSRYYDHLNQTMPDLYRIEQAIPEVLLDMEARGIILSKFMANKARKFYESCIEAAKEKLFELGGNRNPNSKGKWWYNSNAQVAAFLEGRGIRLPKLQSGAFAVSAPALLNVLGEDPAIGVLLELRHAQKLLATYVEGMLEEAEVLADGSLLLHPNYSQAGTKLGRLSSSNPNLQNVPREEGDAKPIKDMIVGREGFDTFSADYKGLQLVIAAGLCGDETMKNLAETGDLHGETTKAIFTDPDGSKGQRTMAKNINFGMIFGAGVGKVAFMLAVAEYDFKGAKSPSAASLFEKVEHRHRVEARALIEKWKGMFPGLWKYRNLLLYQLEHFGFIEDPMGRRHFVPRKEAYAVVVNNVQGLEAGFAKGAMRDMHELYRPYKGAANLLLQTHDEISFEIHKDLTKKLLPLSLLAMESQAENRLPVKLEVKCSKWSNSWGTTKEI